MKKKNLARYQLAQTLYAMRLFALMAGKMDVACAIEHNLADMAGSYLSQTLYALRWIALMNNKVREARLIERHLALVSVALPNERRRNSERLFVVRPGRGIRQSFVQGVSANGSF